VKRRGKSSGERREDVHRGEASVGHLGGAQKRPKRGRRRSKESTKARIEQQEAKDSSFSLCGEDKVLIGRGLGPDQRIPERKTDGSKRPMFRRTRYRYLFAAPVDC